MTFCGCLSTSNIIDELIYRSKIRINSTIETIVFTHGLKNTYQHKLYRVSQYNLKYLIICNFNPVTCEKLLDDILLHYGNDYVIIIIYHQYIVPVSLLWYKNNDDMEDLFRLLRERYIGILDVDRIFTIENWLTTESYFSIILITK